MEDVGERRGRVARLLADRATGIEMGLHFKLTRFADQNEA